MTRIKISQIIESIALFAIFMAAIYAGVAADYWLEINGYMEWVK